MAWAGAVVATVAIGIAGGVYDRSKAGVPGTTLFPFFSWDFGWYNAIAHHGYPPVADRFYAFFPLWPWLLRASSSIPDWQLAGAVTLAASALAFLGIAAGSPGRRPRQAALALACWPGSFALLLAYPDGLALAAAAWAAALVLRERPLLAAPLVGAAVAVELFFWTRSDHVDAFFHAQRLWGRHGPTGIGRWADHVRDRVDAHLAPVAILLV